MPNFEKIKFCTKKINYPCIMPNLARSDTGAHSAYALMAFKVAITVAACCFAISNCCLPTSIKAAPKCFSSNWTENGSVIMVPDIHNKTRHGQNNTVYSKGRISGNDCVSPRNNSLRLSPKLRSRKKNRRQLRQNLEAKKIR